MSVVLASTWDPHGELPRLERMAGALRELYGGVVIVVPESVDTGLVAAARMIEGIEVNNSVDWQSGRQHALRLAGSLSPRLPLLDAHNNGSMGEGESQEFVHYCDLDRLLHWLECYPDELGKMLDRLRGVDCLITGRTDQAWATHPRCMFETEAIFNMTFSHLVGTEADFGAGSIGISRRAAEYLIGLDLHAWGFLIDAAWPLILQRAGFRVEYFAADGLEWETPDRYRDRAADAAERAALAAEHDASAEVWRHRAYIAREITRVGLLAAERFAQETHHG